MKPFHVWVHMALCGGISLLQAQTSIDLRTQTKSVDFSSAVSTKPSKVGATLPLTCSVGETFFNSAAPSGRNFYGCTATNSWTLLGTNLWFGGGSVSPGDCAKFDGSGNIVSSGGSCGSGTTTVTMASPFSAPGSLLISAGAGRQGTASLCTESAGSLACPGGFAGHITWLGGTGTNNRQLLGPTGPFFTNFNYRWSDTVPNVATLMKIGAPSGGEASLGPAIPDADYVTPTGYGILQNKTMDGSNVFSSYQPWAQISKPSAPAGGFLRVYAKTGSGLCWLNSAGTETCPSAVASVFGRTGTVTAQSGDYSYAQITDTPAALPPNGAASGDLSGSYPNPMVAQVNGAAVPAAGMLKANAGRQLVQAIAGSDYAPPTNGTSMLKGNGSGGFASAGSGQDYETPLTFSGPLNRVGDTIACGTASAAAAGCLSAADWNTFSNKQSALTNPVTGTGSAGSLAKFTGGGTIGTATAGTDFAPPTPGTSLLKGNGSGGFSSVVAADVVGMFSGCSGSQYLGADGACHTASGTNGGGYVVLTTGTGAPSASCSAPSTTNLEVYVDITAGDEWWCSAANSWKKALSVTGTGPYLVTGATGSAPGTPSSGFVTCYFDASVTQTCLDATGDAWQLVKTSTLAGLRIRSCDLAYGNTKSGTAPLEDGDLGPQVGICFIPAAATVLEIEVRANAGTPSIILGVEHEGTVSNLVSSALGTASNGERACAKTSGVAGIDGTTCAATLQNTSLAAGDYIQAVSGTAGGAAKWMTVHVVYAID